MELCREKLIPLGVDFRAAEAGGELPFEDGSFDLVLNPPSLFYVPDVMPVFREVYRVLKSGGSFIMISMAPIAYVCDYDEALGCYKAVNRMPYRSTDHADQGDWVEYGHTMESYIGGQLECGFVLTGQSYALLLALGLAVLDFIPILGAGTVMIPWAVVELLVGDYFRAVVVIVIWGAVALFRRVAEPKFVGDQTGLSPFLSLVSIYVGMRLAGVVGMILGPVVTLVALNLLGLGLLDGWKADVSLAVRDTTAVLCRERDEEPDRK